MTKLTDSSIRTTLPARNVAVIGMVLMIKVYRQQRHNMTASLSPAEQDE